MKELSPSRIERINRSDLVRFRKAELTDVQKWDRFMGFIALAFAFLILACILIVHAEWSPGEQERIAREYKALRHDAVAMGGWK